MGFGIIGNFIKQFMMFLAGEFWFVILFGVLILGISMLFKRKLPKFFFLKVNWCLYFICNNLSFRTF